MSIAYRRGFSGIGLRSFVSQPEFWVARVFKKRLHDGLTLPAHTIDCGMTCIGQFILSDFLYKTVNK
jgi:hypothetical protein